MAGTNKLVNYLNKKGKALACFAADEANVEDKANMTLVLTLPQRLADAGVNLGGQDGDSTLVGFIRLDPADVERRQSGRALCACIR